MGIIFIIFFCFSHAQQRHALFIIIIIIKSRINIHVHDQEMSTERGPERNLMRETALTGFFLGACFMFALVLICHSLWYTGSVEEYAAGVYILCIPVLFHMSEFLVAASLGRHDTHPDTFLLTHSGEYTAATSAAWIEFFLEWLLVPERWKVPRGTFAGWLLRLNYSTVTVAAVMAVAFYLVRVVGMLHCGRNFSLLIETERRASHVLVDNGIYAVLRHPAYFGFFWRTLCSQLVLANPLCLVLYAVVMWHFFSCRIAYEESVLEGEEFFGERYKAYKAKTMAGIPFIYSRRPECVCMCVSLFA
ncbi:prenyl protein specific carboxyl methyltransferase, putative [Trypanosoma cruzi]|uniref:Protein-S-isoprenylcysteine O-methyltransferase n=2 Tax=Trypanosoma cruzi TaxID=5693 RepID=Q4D7B7_TRYCC|nr:prenyl protein specific carboxyl methyltransferase, putative [Trypanosoma cruzi]EAN88414.1 prenyl protein specific carboxyl methyltransferase, putative [Trypanosoma cruzi]|eukprot:XP_810265.1 prenyl protein specific carboxyl methyltransferase [Trypanosoma cruzi strain CL Brener]